MGPHAQSWDPFSNHICFSVTSHFMALHVNSKISISSLHASPYSWLRHPAASLTSISMCERRLRFNMSKIRLLISPQNLLPTSLANLDKHCSIVLVVQAEDSSLFTPTHPYTTSTNPVVSSLKYIQNLTPSHSSFRSALFYHQEPLNWTSWLKSSCAHL